MKSKLKSYEVKNLLRRIADGKVSATEEPKLPGCDRKFTTPNGWSFVIFDDCGQMDYVDRAESPNGRKGDFDDWTRNNPMPWEWRDSRGDNPLGRALKWIENSDYR